MSMASSGPTPEPDGEVASRLSEQFNILDPEQARNPYEMFQQSRLHCPVFYSQHVGAWIVTRYDDIVAIAQDTQRFSSAYANKTTQPIPDEVAAINATVHWEVPGLVDNDPPRHTRVRKLTNQAFTPPRVRAMEPAIRQTAEELVEGMLRAEQHDLQEQFSIPLPLMTIMRILGLPDHDAPQIRTWSSDYNNERAAHLSVEDRLRYTHGRSALRFYMASHVEDRRARPKDDTITHLAQAEVDGERLDTWEIVTVLQSLVHAGHETTIGLLGTLMYHLLSQRERWEAVCADPGLRPVAVEEALRREGSVNGMFRIALEDVEIHGVPISKGSFIQLMFSSGSHDEAYFPNPLEFDLHRERSREHMAFGKGRHYCIGAPLARAEALIALNTLCERIPTLRLTRDAEERITFMPSVQFRGRLTLPVEWD